MTDKTLEAHRLDMIRAIELDIANYAEMIKEQELRWRALVSEKTALELRLLALRGARIVSAEKLVA